MSFCIKYSFKLFLFTLSFPHAKAIASLSATTCICTIVSEGEGFGQNECFALEQRYNPISNGDTHLLTYMIPRYPEWCRALVRVS